MTLSLYKITHFLSNRQLLTNQLKITMVSLENFLNKNIYIKFIAHCYSGVLTVTLVSLIMTFTVTYWKELIVLILSGFVIGYLLTIGSIAEDNCLWDTLVSVFILGVTILLTVLGSEVTGLPLWGYMALTGACAMLEYKLEQWVSNLNGSFHFTFGSN